MAGRRTRTSASSPSRSAAPRRAPSARVSLLPSGAADPSWPPAGGARRCSWCRTSAGRVARSAPASPLPPAPLQSPKAGQSVRVAGSTLKVWDAGALLARRPLLAVHDVLKHLQLEDGRLFLWRVADDAVVLMVGAARLRARPGRAGRGLGTGLGPYAAGWRQSSARPGHDAALGHTASRCKARRRLRPHPCRANPSLPHPPNSPTLPCPAQHCSDPGDAAGQEEAARWTEHPAIVASVLEPGAAGAPRLRDIPLEATYGRWGGWVVGVGGVWGGVSGHARLGGLACAHCNEPGPSPLEAAP